jgi:peptidoglycan/xylan/chitin deacetylase (PgdA/CDA1 family)
MRRSTLRSRRAVTTTVLLIVLLLVIQLPSTIAQQATPGSTPTPSPPTGATPAATAPLDLQALGVNELGTIPILMYHAFTADPTDNIWSRTIGDFWNDLFWLYDHDFYVISLRDLVDNTIAAPAGKHPVVLTFDDASANQFQFIVGSDDELVPSPSSAVGVLESFFADYPDFGRGGHFAVTGSYCFANSDDPAGVNTWETHCPLKLQWLSDHGYEVGNHTWTHPSLATAPGHVVNDEVGQTAAFIDTNVDGAGNQATILTLPYGEIPAEGTEGAAYLTNGVWWNGEHFMLDAITLVDGGPAYSPSSSWYNRYRIKRFNTDSASLATWFGRMTSGEVPLYTSDGNPDTVTIPDPLPEFLQNEFDPAVIAASGKELIRYPDDGTYVEPELTTRPKLAPGVVVVTSESGVRLRAEPGTDGDLIKPLRNRTTVTIVEGPKKADKYTWWKVRLEDGTEGWLAESFLAGPPASP